MENDYKKYNIYQKINLIRKELLDTFIEKTGNNNHKKYDYYRKIDLINAIHPINLKYGIFYLTNMDFYNSKVANITLINTDNTQEQVTFTTGCSISNTVSGGGYSTEDPVIMLGKGITYIERYLLIIAYGLDSTDKAEENNGAKTFASPKQIPSKPSEEKKIDIESRKKYIRENFNKYNEDKQKEVFAKYKSSDIRDLLFKSDEQVNSVFIELYKFIKGR